MKTLNQGELVSLAISMTLKVISSNMSLKESTEFLKKNGQLVAIGAIRLTKEVVYDVEERGIDVNEASLKRMQEYDIEKFREKSMKEIILSLLEEEHDCNHCENSEVCPIKDEMIKLREEITKESDLTPINLKKAKLDTSDDPTISNKDVFGIRNGMN